MKVPCTFDPLLPPQGGELLGNSQNQEININNLVLTEVHTLLSFT
jgi:hypothetical protein